MKLAHFNGAAFGDIASDILTGAISQVVIRTTVLPDLVIDTQGVAASGPPNPIVQALAPQVFLNGPTGQVAAIQPYGNATISWLSFLVWGGFFGAMALAYGAGRRSARRSV